MNKQTPVTIEQILEGYPLAEVIQNEIISEVSAQLMIKRFELKMNQEEFANRLGISQSSLSKYENGTKNLTAKKIGEILGKLELTVKLQCEPLKAIENTESEKTSYFSTNITEFLIWDDVGSNLVSGF